MQSAAPKFFRSDADFPTFRRRKEFGCRPARAKRVAGAGGRARMRIDGGDRSGQKKVARCGEGWGGFRTVGGSMERRVLFCSDSGARDGMFGAFGCTSGFRVPANGSGPGALFGRRGGRFGNLVRTRYLCGRNHSLNHVSQKGTYLLRSEVRHRACLPGSCPLVQRLHLTDKVCRRPVRGCGG